MRATRFEFQIRGFVIGAIIAVGFACRRWDAVHAPRVVMVVGAGLAFVAALLRTWSTAYLTSDVVHDREVRAESVVADGPYRWVRNPLYVAVLLMVLGVAATASPLGAAVMVVGVTFFLLRLIGGEEAALLASQGESYRAYLAAVPRLVPALRPRLPASGNAPRWGQAIVGEAVFWAVAAGLLWHALDGDWLPMGALSLAAVAARFVQGVRARRAKERR